MGEYYRLIRHGGNRDLFRMVEMSVAALVNGQSFHIQAEGLRGTGKTTIMRTARELLPPITRIKNCLYNCDPAMPHCPVHRHLPPAEIEALGVEQVPRPFLEISQAAKPSTIVGSIDLARLTNPVEPQAALLPGTIPQAHRGIIFIDEVNRLADTSPELADILLDVMGTRPGRVQIEEAGLPVVELPVHLCIWAASNPDENPGPLSRIRKQLADRFDVTVTMGRPDTEQAVVEILAGHGGSDAPGGAVNLTTGCLDRIEMHPKIRQLLARLYITYNLESLRTVAAMETAVRLAALLAGQSSAGLTELAQVAPFVLAHRVSKDTIAAIMSDLHGLLYGQVKKPETVSATAQLARQTLSRWTRPWAALAARLAAVLPNKYPLPGSHIGGGKGEQGTAHIADPLNTVIIAPPKPATPLNRLPDEQLVSREANPHA
ncbi:hypothetical protein SPACI_000440 [Sporomusa acidovorans DSM 3132]|uniref:ChlI/MoxR AAA lid domain-containing protein n=2 Tax=Sporomusa TaxID=2375 RepID=A0ABZ3IVG4_SPOA4|nr:hypothetical protein [Sporomusa acidovorans]OZC15281.1 magnesium-chelatase 38 kDa subunit [Sporomusa acidovorans DSM 3132]SDE91970.1 magnesium chelatase subunit I [Sporomusa acidovorans]